MGQGDYDESAGQRYGLHCRMGGRKVRNAVCFFFALLSSSLLSGDTGAVRALREAPRSRAVYETEIAAPIARVWNAFTTNEGLQAWMAPKVEIDLAVGGAMRSSYDLDGELGDSSTIVNTILSYDPERMLSLQATQFPTGSPLAEAAQGTWSIFYFQELETERTRITVVGLGFNESEASQQIRQFFATANARLLEGLKQALASD